MPAKLMGQNGVVGGSKRTSPANRLAPSYSMSPDTTDQVPDVKRS